MKCNIDYRENNRWTVYVHVVPKTLSGYDWDKYYVGITSQTTYERWGKNGYRYKNSYFKKAINKYGWNNMQHEIIAEHLTEDEAKNMEITLISILKSNDKIYGYNITKGGDEYQLNIRPVAKYDLDGNFICVYKSIAEAARQNRVRKTTICAACKGENKRAGNFLWRYVIDNKIENKITPYKSRISIILQYDLYGNFIKEWIDYKLIQEEFPNYNINSIFACCRGEEKYAYEYQWRYKGDKFFPVENIKDKIGRKTYYRYTLNGKYLDCWEGGKSIKEKFNIAPTCICAASRDIRDNCYKWYRWTKEYYEKLPPLKKNANINRGIRYPDKMMTPID